MWDRQVRSPYDVRLMNDMSYEYEVNYIRASGRDLKFIPLYFSGCDVVVRGSVARMRSRCW